jgi:hypothetical protein
MALLFDEDYEILKNSGLLYAEDEANRFLIIRNYPLLEGLYIFNNKPVEMAEVLVVIPANYNTSGNDMFWVYPALKRTDGQPIPAVMEFGGGDARFFDSKEYCRWSRHYPPEAWLPKVDNIEKILSRIEWALKKPDAQK